MTLCWRMAATVALALVLPVAALAQTRPPVLPVLGTPSVRPRPDDTTFYKPSPAMTAQIEAARRRVDLQKLLDGRIEIFAVVEKDRLLFTIPGAVVKVPLPESQRYGFYLWRLDTSDREGLSMVLAADTAMRTANLVDIVRSSRLRLCPTAKEPSGLNCTRPLIGGASAHDTDVRMEIRDTGVVSMVRRRRPVAVWMTSYSPQGLFRIDSLKIVYRDRDK